MIIPGTTRNNPDKIKINKNPKRARHVGSL
jgi:hypothetical protein